MKIYLAPMEGLADHNLRKILARTGGFDLVITEFIRVTNHLLPASVFTRHSPELLNSGQTEDGTPVRIQLLGNDHNAMAQNAARAIELGSHGIDINFGCPSKTVNKSKGGAVLLKEPETIFRVVKAVREAVPLSHPTSAKMRLGFEDTSLMWECAHAIADAGASEVIVHARTKAQGYKPPAYWEKVASFEKTLGIPVVINGEIWTTEDAKNALQRSNSSHIMIGRGAVRQPCLASQIKANAKAELPWDFMLNLIDEFWKGVCLTMSERYCAGRLKQWLSHLQHTYPIAGDIFSDIRTVKSRNDISLIISRYKAQ